MVDHRWQATRIQSSLLCRMANTSPLHPILHGADMLSMARAIHGDASLLTAASHVRRTTAHPHVRQDRRTRSAIPFGGAPALLWLSKPDALNLRFFRLFGAHGVRSWTRMGLKLGTNPQCFRGVCVCVRVLDTCDCVFLFQKTG